MSKKKKPSRKVITLDDAPASRKRLRLAAEDDWQAALPRLVEKFLSLFRERSKNFRIAPFKIRGLEQKRRTKRQERILLETGTRMLASFYTAKRARSDNERQKAYWDGHERLMRHYEKTLFGKLSDSPKKRAGLQFLREWDYAEIYDDESTCVETVTLTLPLRIINLLPLLAALNRRDDEFFDGLAQAIRFLGRYGNDTVAKWLIEHQDEIKPYTPDEIIERFPQCPTKSVKRLHNELNELKLDHAEKLRGTASPNYGFKKGWAELETRLKQA
jgi:hypothetical protein